MPARRQKAARIKGGVAISAKDAVGVKSVDNSLDGSNVIVEIEATPEIPAPRHELTYSPIESACATPAQTPPMLIAAKYEEQTRGPLAEIVRENPEEDVAIVSAETDDYMEWSDKERRTMEALVERRRTVTVQWDVIAAELSRATGITRSALDCERQHVDLLAEEYDKSAKKPAATRRQAEAGKTRSTDQTPLEFKSKDPTRKFKMTKLLAERTFRPHPAALLSPTEPKRTRRYSFIEDTLAIELSSDKADVPRKSALSFLQDVLPDRKRPSLKLDDDRFLQKFKGAAKKCLAAQDKSSASAAPTSKRRLASSSKTLEKIVGELTAETDDVNVQCMTKAGLREELVALEHGEEEFQILLDEIENIDSSSRFID